MKWYYKYLKQLYLNIKLQYAYDKLYEKYQDLLIERI